MPHPSYKSPTPFVTRMFDETMELMLESQEYFTHSPTSPHVTPVERIVYTAEASRITLRISSVMAWLMARNAELSGQITREEAAAQFKLAFPDVCLQQLPAMEQLLPPDMCELLERSLELYQRAARLDSMIVPETIH